MVRELEALLRELDADLRRLKGDASFQRDGRKVRREIAAELALYSFPVPAYRGP